MKLHFIISIIIAIGLFSCESLINDIPPSKLPKAESKLVVHAFISPQAENINVTVSESEPLFGTSPGPNGILPDALVKISNGLKEVVIPYDKSGNIYSIEAAHFPIIPSKTYYLTVSRGNKKVTAECAVPEKSVTIKSFTLDTIDLKDPASDQTKFATLKMNWQDIAGEANFYRVHASMMLEYGVPVKDGSNEGKETMVTSGFNFQWDESSGRGELQTDNALDGLMFSSPLGKVNLVTVMGVDKFSLNNPKIKSLTMEVFNTDINYYKYHRDMDLRGNADNPFAEPSMIHSNIVGGLGCFGAYNVGRRVELY
ncbi:DUF4249 domain-containing protein [Dyadobacter luticola]|uniref:DUF4249 domain-containing protein n=1 Tax=Dyadobacter luticola TaxID=1979387 RepID=A0A5R9L5U6_9BACT|nr:DUF4249 domain-containing protein [Dyadobacter luticola]TLV03759.1 DUF4249 domain-containing protein [Dyadobacter luticola]